MHALHDAFGKPKRAISALESRLRRFDLDNSGLIAEKASYRFLAKVPFVRDFLNRVVIFECAHIFSHPSVTLRRLVVDSIPELSKRSPVK
jgi:hypothetical protein